MSSDAPTHEEPLHLSQSEPRIPVTCPQCGKSGRTPRASANARIVCKSCHTGFVLSSPPRESTAKSPAGTHNASENVSAAVDAKQRLFATKIYAVLITAYHSLRRTISASIGAKQRRVAAKMHAILTTTYLSLLHSSSAWYRVAKRPLPIAQLSHYPRTHPRFLHAHPFGGQ